MTLWSASHTNNSISAAQNKAIIDVELYGTKNVVAGHGAYLIPNTLMAGVFLLQDKASRKCSTAALCNNSSCVRYLNHLASISFDSLVETTVTFSSTVDMPLSCAGAFTISTDLAQDVDGLVSVSQTNPSSTEFLNTFTITASPAAPTQTFDIITSVVHTSTGSTLDQ